MPNEKIQMRKKLTCSTPYETVKAVVGPGTGIRKRIEAGTLFGEVEPFNRVPGANLEDQLARYKEIDISKVAFQILDVVPFTCGMRHGYDIYIKPYGLYADVTRAVVKEAGAVDLSMRAFVNLTGNDTDVPTEVLSQVFTFDLTSPYTHSPQVDVQGIMDNSRKGKK